MKGAPAGTSAVFLAFWRRRRGPFTHNAAALLYEFSATLSGDYYERRMEVEDAAAWLSGVFPQQAQVLVRAVATWHQVQVAAVARAAAQVEAYLQYWIAEADIAAARVEVYRCEPWIGDLRAAVDHLLMVNEETAHPDLEAMLKGVDEDTRLDLLATAPDLRVWQEVLSEVGG